MSYQPDRLICFGRNEVSTQLAKVLVKPIELLQSLGQRVRSVDVLAAPFGVGSLGRLGHFFSSLPVGQRLLSLGNPSSSDGSDVIIACRPQLFCLNVAALRA